MSKPPRKEVGLGIWRASATEGTGLKARPCVKAAERRLCALGRRVNGCCEYAAYFLFSAAVP
jgi:hypothetical protein